MRMMSIELFPLFVLLTQIFLKVKIPKRTKLAKMQKKILFLAFSVANILIILLLCRNLDDVPAAYMIT